MKGNIKATCVKHEKIYFNSRIRVLNKQHFLTAILLCGWDTDSKNNRNLVYEDVYVKKNENRINRIKLGQTSVMQLVILNKS